MTQLNQSNQRSFNAALTSIDEKEHTATYYLMNTSANRNRWGVTDKALVEALPTLKGKPIGMGKGYKLGHFNPAESMNTGVFIDYEQHNGYATGKAKITDAQTWAMMKNKELSPTSVVIEVYAENCSLCGDNLKPYQAYWHEHSCIKLGKAHSLVSSFKFERVDFVAEPAYPQAGVLEMSAQVQATSSQNYQTALKAAVEKKRREWGFRSLEEPQVDPALKAAIERTRRELGIHL